MGTPSRAIVPPMAGAPSTTQKNDRSQRREKRHTLRGKGGGGRWGGGERATRGAGEVGEGANSEGVASGKEVCVNRSLINQVMSPESPRGCVGVQKAQEKESAHTPGGGREGERGREGRREDAAGGTGGWRVLAVAWGLAGEGEGSRPSTQHAWRKEKVCGHLS